MKKDAWNRNDQKIWKWTELLYVPLCTFLSDFLILWIYEI